MISTKNGTQTWSTANNQKLQSAKTNNIENDPAFKKAFGDKKLGDVLNSIANPNFKGNPTRKVGNPELDKDAFFKLMLTQLKNQDPTNPLKSHEMAAQLAHFSSIEQLNNIDKTLKNMEKQGKPDHTAQLMGLIGKNVKGDSSVFVRNQNDKQHTVEFDLLADSKKVNIEVKDRFGKTIKAFEMKDMKAGKNSLTWNGVNEDGLDALAGDYRFEIKAINGKGRSIPVQTDFEGQITGMKFVKGNPVLMVGNKTIKMKDIQEISEPQHKFMSMNGGGMIQQRVPTHNDVTPAGQNKKSTGVQNAPLPNNLESVKMNQGLINKVDKTVGGK